MGDSEQNRIEVGAQVLERETPAVAPTPEPDPPVEKVRFARLKRLHAWAHRNPVSSFITKIIVTILGTLLILAGIIMLFTPGQGILAVIAGLAVLSSEYEWAKRLRLRAEAKLKETTEAAKAMDPAVRRRRILLGDARDGPGGRRTRLVPRSLRLAVVRRR